VIPYNEELVYAERSDNKQRLDFPESKGMMLNKQKIYCAERKEVILK
jgi:hypothetical protein